MTAIIDCPRVVRNPPTSSLRPLMQFMFESPLQIPVDTNKYQELSVDIYLSQKGWHGAKDRLLVWMSTPSGAFTMLPKCAESVTKLNVDSLGLRAPNPSVGGDPSDVPEPYEWRTLRAKLGAGSSTVSVCAALQTGAGAEALYIDNVALRERSTATTCDALGGDVLGFTAASSRACGVLSVCGFEDSEARDSVRLVFGCVGVLRC